MMVRRAHPLQSEEQWVPGSRVVLHPLQRSAMGTRRARARRGHPAWGFTKGVCPLRGDRTRGLAPFVGGGEAGFRADPATVGGSIPLAGSIPSSPLAREKHSDSMLLGSAAPALPTGNEVLRRNRVSPARQNHNLRHNSGRSGEAHPCRRRRPPPEFCNSFFA